MKVLFNLYLITEQRCFVTFFFSHVVAFISCPIHKWPDLIHPQNFSLLMLSTNNLNIFRLCYQFTKKSPTKKSGGCNQGWLGSPSIQQWPLSGEDSCMFRCPRIAIKKRSSPEYLIKFLYIYRKEYKVEELVVYYFIICLGVFFFKFWIKGRCVMNVRKERT